MLDAFASVGATHFDVTLTNLSGYKRLFREMVPLSDVARNGAVMMDYATKRQQSLIVRPRSDNTTFIQLDDLKHTDHLVPTTFLSFETSPGNFQAWAALKGKPAWDVPRRLRVGVGADKMASGATRLAGTFNFKGKYAPHFPRIALTRIDHGRLTTVEALESMALLAPPEPVRPLSLFDVNRRWPGDRRRWPSYDFCVERAPLSYDKKGPDTVRADFVWCMTALNWGWNRQETAHQLLQLSEKAQRNGARYAEKTVERAAGAVAHRIQQVPAPR